ncbi:MAG: TonB-dependent receptor [Spirosomataceae bacterium]
MVGSLSQPFAQPSLRGQIKDSLSQAPVEYASIGIYRTSDNQLVNGTISDSMGVFLVSGLKPGAYFLKIEFVGYKTKVVQNVVVDRDKTNDIGIILVQRAALMLSEVTVTGQREAAQNKLDKQVYRADAFQAAKGGTAVDVLRNMPAISVNAEGDIRLRGSTGFLVLINGKPTTVDAATVLNQIPANAIENIEIITAPSAKYDADGKAGIINITTKKGTDDGLSFMVNTQVGLPSTNDFGNEVAPKRYGADGTLNYKKGPWEVSLGGSYQKNDIAGRRVGDVNTTINNRFTSFPSVGERSFKRQNYAARAAITYTPGKNNTFSAGFYVGQRQQFRLADITYFNNLKTDLTTGKTISKVTYFNSNLVKKQGDFSLFNLDYTHTFANKSALTLSGLYEGAVLSGFTHNLNASIDSRRDTLDYVSNPARSPLTGLRLKADYVINIGKGKLESGYQFRKQNQTGSFQYLNLILGTGRFSEVPEFSADIDVDNLIHALYSQYSAKKGKLEYLAGLRYEYATRTFRANKQPQPFDLELSNFFPSVNAIYSVKSDLKLKAGFSRRVQRSTSNELNPYPEREHSETLEQGDPNIKPEFVNLTEIGIIKDFGKGSVFVTAYNQRITNVVNRVNSVYNDTILNRIYTNAGKAMLWGIETGLNLKPTARWTVFFGGNVYDYRIKGSLFNNAVAVNNSGIAFSINTNQTVTFSKTLSAQFNLNYLSLRPTAQGEDSRFVSPNVSAKKTFWGGKLSAVLQWQNVDFWGINANEQRITTWGRDFYTTTNYIQEKNVFMLNLSYSFKQTNRKIKLPTSEFGEREF